MSFLEIKSAIDRLAEAHEAYKQTNDKRLAALEKGDKSAAAELGDKLEKIDADVMKFAKLKEQIEKEHAFQRERIEMLEARASNPKKTAGDVLRDEYTETFENWIKAKGQDSNLESKMQQLMKKALLEHKDITIGTPSGGGYAVPEQIGAEIERLEQLFSPVRSLVKVVKTTTSDYKELVSINGASSGWVGETGSRTATDTPTLREVTPTHGEIYAYPQVSEWSLDDIAFNVEQWLSDNVAMEFAIREGEAVISGNGTNKPTGMLNTTPLATDDHASPLRDAAAYEYVSSDTDDDDSPAAPGIRSDALIDLVFKINSIYRAGAQWTMNSTTTAAVRKLKTADGIYHWQPGLQAGQPAMLLGFPVNTWEQMPDIGLNTFPIGFGNWRRAYLMVDRVGLRVTRDNVTNPGYVRFYIRKRVGGKVLNNDAVKFLRTSG